MTPMCAQVHDIYQTNPADLKNLSRYFMFQHCQPMRNHHTEQLQEGNGKITLTIPKPLLNLFKGTHVRKSREYVEIYLLYNGKSDT